jgi:hypothetical protein
MIRNILLSGLLVFSLAALAVAGIEPLRATALSLWQEEPQRTAAPDWDAVGSSDCTTCTLRHRAMQRNKEILSKQD